MKNFKHPLMHNNIQKEDFKKIINFLKSYPKLTQGKKVEEFEKKWSKWLGVKYSVFVNSGSSANFITMAYLKTRFKKGSEIILPALTWPSDIMAVILNEFKPVFVDIDIKTLSMNNDLLIKKISNKTVAVFLTHAQGFVGLKKETLKYLKKKKILLFEDVCESHGAKFLNKKLGTFGIASNFSFYYAHHLSTIEGGMVCTNDRGIYDFCTMFRGHGMLRESKFIKTRRLAKKYPQLNPKFIFINAGFNMRNNEIGAVLGINQLPRLNLEIKKRNSNLKYFLKNLNSDTYVTDFNLSGCSNYAFPILLKNKSFKFREKFEKILIEKKIEFRRGNAGGGNQLRQPYLKKYRNDKIIKELKNTDYVHFFGYYIGNYPSLKKTNLDKILKILNSI